ncbi:hypothetical protein ACLOJK_035475 [Asimina triloba]
MQMRTKLAALVVALMICSSSSWAMRREALAVGETQGYNNQQKSSVEDESNYEQHDSSNHHTIPRSKFRASPAAGDGSYQDGGGDDNN